MEETKISVKYEPEKKSRSNQSEAVAELFRHIANKQVDEVSKIIVVGLAFADTPNDRGETPLIAAVTTNDAAMIRTLVSLGATINGYGSYYDGHHKTKVLRTPLQVAASQGKLGIVKILRDLGADDSLVAPDGAIALRLAAENGHREVVEYLPARRGGAWKRWKATHEKQMRLVRLILENIGSVLEILFWRIPKFILWKIPKHVVTTVPKEIWERRHKVGPWCKRQIYKFPSRVKKVAKSAHEGVRKAGNVVKKTPAKIWDILKRIPGALRIILSWVGRGLGHIGNAAFNIVKRLASLIHTVAEAVVGFFRAVTLHDIVNGFRAVLGTLLIDFPGAVAWFVTTVGKTAYEVLGAVLGTLGKVIFYAFALILRLLRWLPKQMWEMLLACGKSVDKGMEEILVWINPKRI